MKPEASNRAMEPTASRRNIQLSMSSTIVGAIYGLAFSLVIYLGKGGPKSGDAPYVIPSGIITGGLAGLFTFLFAVKKIQISLGIND